MRKEYIVAVDFGHGETSAWIVPMENQMEHQGDALKLRTSNKVELRTIYSVIYQDKNGNFSLDNTDGNVIGGFKKKVCDLRKDTQKYKAYTEFIKAIYKRLLNMNDDRLHSDGEGNTNFYLCIACPTKWSNDDRIEYVNFFNEALKEFGVEVMWVINESDAAYFSHGSTSEFADKCVLIIDYGSSTIDYTLMYKGKKISDDQWSNDYLGASNIEKSILMEYSSQKDYQEVYQKTEEKLRHDALGWLHIQPEVLLEIRKAKENCVIEGYYPDFMLRHNVIQRHDILVGSDPNWRRDRMSYLFDYECDMDECLVDYKEGVYTSFDNLAGHISQKLKGSNVDTVIMSGGASLMPWVKEMVKSTFPTAEIKLDNNASFVVSKGAALYARDQIKAFELFMEKIDAYQYKDVYIDADRTATNVAVDELFPPFADKLCENSHTAAELRDEGLNFLFCLNSQNQKYCNIMTDTIRTTISQKVANDIKEVVQSVFSIDISVDDIHIDINPDILNFPEIGFEKGGEYYEKISSEISRPFFSITWDKMRTVSECRKIIGTIHNWLKGVSKGFKYDENSLASSVDNIKQQVKTLAKEVFYKYQLFQTTFKG